ncbi:MAG: transcriptional repressor [Streptosporangiales bacterium]|nr:transcriptional repressor [Streptosporangiales bacterium]
MVEDWVALLRARGYRLTQQRRLVLDAVRDLGHATPEQLYTHLRDQRDAVDLATVYRTLELLVELELVGHSRLAGVAESYHLVAHADHVHLVCRSCERVSEAPIETATAFAQRVRDEQGFEPDLGHLVVFGRCAECAAAT